MSTVTVNKLDKNDESEFEIETLDDIQSGGASTASTGTPNLSVPLNNNSIKVNSLERENSSPNMSEKVASEPLSSTKPSSMQESVKPNTPMSEPKSDEEDESEFPEEGNEAKEATVNKPKSSESTLQSTQEEDKELVNNLESAQKTNVIPEVNTTQKTKKKVKKVKKVGATKKKVVAAQQISTPINNDVQPHVEFGNERGTMTIKYASAKTTVPLYSNAKSSHLDLASIKAAFDTEYDTVKAMTAEQVTELRHEMQNTEFSDIGSDALIHGLLSLIDDHDTKKLTLKMMLVRGLLKVKA